MRHLFVIKRYRNLRIRLATKFSPIPTIRNFKRFQSTKYDNAIYDNVIEKIVKQREHTLHYLLIKEKKNER